MQVFSFFFFFLVIDRVAESLEEIQATKDRFLMGEHKTFKENSDTTRTRSPGRVLGKHTNSLFANEMATKAMGFTRSTFST